MSIPIHKQAKPTVLCIFEQIIKILVLILYVIRHSLKMHTRLSHVTINMIPGLILHIFTYYLHARRKGRSTFCFILFTWLMSVLIHKKQSQLFYAYLSQQNRVRYYLIQVIHLNMHSFIACDYKYEFWPHSGYIFILYGVHARR